MKKLVLAICLVSSLMLTACSKEPVNIPAPDTKSEVTAPFEKNTGYPETPDTDLKVNIPLGEDNEVGGLYNVVTGSYDEVKEFLEDSISNIYSSSDNLEYGQLYHSFLFVEDDMSSASGMLCASADDGWAYENIWSISDALGVKASTVVGWWNGGYYDSVIYFNRDKIVYEYWYSDDTTQVVSWENQTDRLERNDILNSRLEQHNGANNPLKVYRDGKLYEVLVGMYDPEQGCLTNITPATVNTEINTVGQVIMIIESSACEKLQVLSNIYG